MTVATTKRDEAPAKVIAPPMRFTCSRKSLYEAVTIVARAITGRSALPILTHVQLIAGDDGFLRLYATDLERAISLKLPAHVITPGTVCAPARTFGEMLNRYPDKADVEIAANASHSLNITSGKIKYTVLGLDGEEYPKRMVTKDATTFTMLQSDLRKALEQTTFAMSIDQTRAMLCVICLIVEAEQITLVATDTHRLAARKMKIEASEGVPRSVMIPAEAIAMLQPLLSDKSEPTVKVCAGTTRVEFQFSGGSELIVDTRNIEGQFPNWQRVVPVEFSRSVTLTVGDFAQTIRRANIVGKENAGRVVFHISSEGVEITTESRIVGSGSESVDSLFIGAALDIAFNGEYVAKALAPYAPEDRVILRLTDALKSAMLSPVLPDGTPDKDYFCVLMPMQIVN